MRRRQPTRSLAVELGGTGITVNALAPGPFAVRDLPAAADELRRAGVELLGEPGPTWQHFRGPDRNVYALVNSKADRIANGTKNS